MLRTHPWSFGRTLRPTTQPRSFGRTLRPFSPVPAMVGFNVNFNATTSNHLNRDPPLKNDTDCFNGCGWFAPLLLGSLLAPEFIYAGLIPSLISQQGLQASSWTTDESAPGSWQDLGTSLVLLSPVDWETTGLYFLQWGTVIGASPIAEALSLNDRTANKFSVSQVWFCCCYRYKKRGINKLFIYRHMYLHL